MKASYVKVRSTEDKAREMLLGPGWLDDNVHVEDHVVMVTLNLYTMATTLVCQ